jgi:hypothetical protein
MYYEIKSDDDNEKKNSEIIFNKNDICDICWEEKALKKLCLKCKLQYCLKCSLKLKNKCCICYRKSNDNLYIDFSGFEINYHARPTLTTLISLFISICIYMILVCIFIVGIVFLAKFLSNITVNMINKIFLYMIK